MRIKALKNGETTFNGSALLLPEEVQDWLGLTDSGGTYVKDDITFWALHKDNDREKLSFAEIAAIIRSAPEGLFTGGV